MYKPHKKLHRLLACISIVSVRCDCATTPVDGAMPLSAGQSETDSSTSVATSLLESTITEGSDSSDAATTQVGDTTGSSQDCGDGQKQGDEQCDNGADNGDDEACTDECKNNICGDGKMGPGEGCDDGNTRDGDDCSSACSLPSCGDGLVSRGEGCDDKNLDETDACTQACTDAICGDGFTQPSNGEECDLEAGNNDSGDCTSHCLKAVCGDGLKGPGEDCDLGADNNNEGSCTAQCLVATCGDGLIGPDEECDLGVKNENSGYCTSQCLDAICGDGFTGPSEQCDNGGVFVGNGCSVNCYYENAKVVKNDQKVEIEDHVYDGSQASMACLDLVVEDNLGIDGVQVEVRISHWNVHDLVIKLYNPDGNVMTLMSRPGCDEAADVKGGCDALSSVAISGESPVWFRNTGIKDAEKMGDSLSGFEVVCKDDGECDYKPNPGKGPGLSLSEFNGNQAEGTWKLCVGDAGKMYAGFLESVVLILWL